MTHGVFLSRIQADPELRGVSAVLFDEVHERSLDNDLALALALDSAGALRDDLRIVAMSATLDVERFRRLLDNPPTIVSEGKSTRSRSATSDATPGRASNRRWRRQFGARLATMKGRFSPFSPALRRSSEPRTC